MRVRHLQLLAGLGGFLRATGLHADDTATSDAAPRVLHRAHATVVGGIGAADGDDVEELYMEQRLDHFDRQNSRTFSQRYFVNKRYWAGAGSDAPVFLCVGGEGPPLTAEVLSESVHCNDMVELAPEHNALLLAVEHRYYGKSNPGEDWATDSLRWLSSQQALADLSSFHGFLSDKEGLTGAEKWVTWGGSYPGMLAGWARLRFPHLFHAAVSSSSPMKAQLDFPQYAEVMRDSLATGVDGVGGSEACASAVETGHALIGEMLQSREGRLELVTTFGLCETTSLEDESARVMFEGDGVVTLPIQENDPACVGTLCNIKAVCGIMTDDGQGPPATGTTVPRGAGFVPWGIKEARLLYRAAAPSTQVERLAAIRKAQRSSSSHVDNDQDNTDPPCEVFPPTDSGGQRRRNGAVEGARSGLRQSWALDTPDPSNPDRAWLYQTCTEFGFYQTCEVGTRCPFTQGLHTLDLDLKMCQEEFGIEPDQVREQVRLTNLYYGADGPRGSRVIFPNGAIDPWHALGILEAPTPDLPVIYVEGASHHFWTHPSKPTDSPDVVKARETIWAQVTAWLEEDD